MSKIKLNVLGISYSQTQTGAYALVLTEENGDRRIPIIIGAFEAQSIAIQLEGLKPPRPLTHDLFLSFATAFKIDLLEVTIYKLEEGVFFSKLTCDDGASRVTIDARTSDAIALALRFKCPIYTTEEIIAKAGIVLDFEKESKGQVKKQSYFEDIEEKSDSYKDELSELELAELKQKLDEAIKNENYEKASRIRDELKRRNDKN
ncbi:MAG: bifunctional nuclease domain-containing protein [Bacteroidota bacterium]